MKVTAIKTPRIEFNHSLQKFLDNIPILKERSVVAITSKVVSACEGRYVSKDKINKADLIKQEADFVFPMDKNAYNICLTIKNGILIPSAGIDESNADNTYILYPSNLWNSAEIIWKYLSKKHHLRELGVIITDSHTTIMRRGVTGIALSWCGFEPLYSYIDKPDLYNRSLKVTQVNIVDALATSAVFTMGEGNEQTPIAIITDTPRITFVDRPPNQKEKESIFIPLNEDLYSPLLKDFNY